MDLKTAVIIATKGRPQEVSNLLDTLALQTVPPDMIIVSACDRSDVAQSNVAAKNVAVLFGPPGLPAQRNRALSSVRGKCDIIIFFDDDFIPSRYWIEHLKILLTTQPDVVCVTGKVLVDGVTIGGLDWSEGGSIVNEADSSKTLAIGDYKTQDYPSPYGCNMAFRAASIEHLTFDERLVLYGWLEDSDFAFRVGEKRVWTDALWGVHLGTTRGRASGLSFGYSQVVNPWYLMKKGSMTPFDIIRTISRALAGNALGSVFQNSHVDRRGRLKGNVIAASDIVCGRWAPERAAEL
jgi:glycosyltransferase involved in cell wall biosynthesis